MAMVTALSHMHVCVCVCECVCGSLLVCHHAGDPSTRIKILMKGLGEGGNRRVIPIFRLVRHFSGGFFMTSRFISSGSTSSREQNMLITDLPIDSLDVFHSGG